METFNEDTDVSHIRLYNNGTLFYFFSLKNMFIVKKKNCVTLTTNFKIIRLINLRSI